MRILILCLVAFGIGIASAAMGYSMIGSITNFLVISGICVIWVILWNQIAKKFNIN